MTLIRKLSSIWFQTISPWIKVLVLWPFCAGLPLSYAMGDSAPILSPSQDDPWERQTPCKQLTGSLCDLLSQVAFQFQASRCTKSYAPVLRMTLKWLFIRACSCSTTSQFDRWPCAQCADRQLSLVARLSCFKACRLLVLRRMKTFKTTPLLFILPLVCGMGHAQDA